MGRTEGKTNNNRCAPFYIYRASGHLGQIKDQLKLAYNLTVKLGLSCVFRVYYLTRRKGVGIDTLKERGKKKRERNLLHQRPARRFLFRGRKKRFMYLAIGCPFFFPNVFNVQLWRRQKADAGAEAKAIKQIQCTKRALMKFLLYRHW